MSRRTVTVLATLAAAAGLTACGNKEEGPVTRGESEARYIDVAGLKYQVQVSRQLNAADDEDAAYLSGIPAAQRNLPKGSVWFAVFMRVENEGEKPLPSAEKFVIEDTLDEEFETVPVDNITAYTPVVVPPGEVVPNSIDVNSFAPTQGKLLLYKIPTAALDNRPLELTITSSQDPEVPGIVDLDV